MKTLSRFTVLILVVLSLSMGIQDAFAAKRLGGGGNSGRQRDTQSLQRAPAPAPTSPNSSTIGPARPAAPAAVNPVPQPAAPALAPQRNSWLGPLAGFAGGALLGGMLFGGHGGGFGGGEGGGFMGLIFMALMVGGFIYLVRRFMFSAPLQNSTGPIPAQWAETPAQPMNNSQSATYTQPSTFTPSEAYAQSAGQPLSAQPLLEQAPLNLPPGFDLPGFIREAKIAFIRLQAANDAGDLNDLKDFTTPQMFAEVSMAIQERGGVQQRVEVLNVEAQLLDVTLQNNEAIASVQFQATVREDQAAPEIVNEIWHVRKLLNTPNATWLLAGIQQVA